jgi:hypothetical protein
MDANHVRERIEMTVDATISADFTLEELSTALQSVKSEKVGGFDGIYLKFIKNAGTRKKEWILSFRNNVLATGRLSKLFKQAKVITILKPGKDGSDS